MVWLTDARLVAAVGNAGGMGVLGPNAGQTVVTRDAEGTAGNMRAEIRKVRELTDAPFAVNALPTQGREDIYTPPMLKVIYEEKVPAVVFVGEPDEAMFAELKTHNVKIIYRSLNPSPANAREAERYGADIIVATGFDEGGTLPDMTLGTFSIVPLIVDAVDHTPVMAAGGIADHRAFDAALALGAGGVYCGTAFLMSKESRMAPTSSKPSFLPTPRTCCSSAPSPPTTGRFPASWQTSSCPWTRPAPPTRSWAARWAASPTCVSACSRATWMRATCRWATVSATSTRSRAVPTSSQS